MPYRTLLSFVILSSFILPASTGSAAGYGKKGQGGGAGNTGNTGNNNNNTPPVPPPVDHSGSIEARKQVAAATAEVTKASAVLASITAALRREFQKKPEWVAAQNAMKDDQLKTDAARDAVLSKLQANAKYKSLKAAKLKAEADRDAMKDNPPSAEDQQRIINAVFTAIEALAKMENDALATDPAVAASKAQLAKDNRRIAALAMEFDAQCKRDPAWQTEMKEVDARQQVAADARKSLASALASEAQAERDRQKQIAGR